MNKLEANPDAVYMGHPLLFKKQDNVDVSLISSETFQHNLDVLKRAQFRLEGIGLAAVQIGWGVQAMCLGIEPEEDTPCPVPGLEFQFWINPEIKKKSDETNWTWEGCISVPGIRGWIERSAEIEVSGYNEEGTLISRSLNGFVARVFQHELDHLNGILFLNRMPDISLVVPSDSLDRQNTWLEDWPTVNARKTLPGTLSSTR
ncbi:MAG: peptide deformylase [Endozoicomonadaceae bacterium]|nr:peptide deformylase [Endozoicomonadaceae bacterium]